MSSNKARTLNLVQLHGSSEQPLEFSDGAGSCQIHARNQAGHASQSLRWALLRWPGARPQHLIVVVGWQQKASDRVSRRLGWQQPSCVKKVGISVVSSVDFDVCAETDGCKLAAAANAVLSQVERSA
tara:strand:+ start:802 stop:1182 length:381 start_codon:yes stop_codon:yes gene_type:complete